MSTVLLFNEEKNFLIEDIKALTIKIKNNNAVPLFISKLAGIGFNNFDTSKKGVIELKLKTGEKQKNVLNLIRKFDDVLYSWYSLKIGSSTIIPTGKIILQPKKGIVVNDIFSRTNATDKIQIKTIDKYGVVTLIILNEDSLFSVSNRIYESNLVDWCHPNFWMPIEKMTNDPLYLSQYYLKNTGQFGGTVGIDINVENAWTINKGSVSIKIAVMDDGVEDHEDLSGRVLSGYTPRNPNGYGAPTSGGYHGEPVAGIIAASHDNSLGIAGIAPNCKIVPVNIFYGGETVADIADGINWAWNNGQADILSNSWGYGQAAPNFDNIIQAINNARTNGRMGKGSIVIFSSGNDYANVSFPGDVDGVITVGAIDKNGNLSNYSNTGPSMDLVAPSSGILLGGDVTTTDRMYFAGYNSGNYTTSFGGTSAACPQVSGVAALILYINPNFTENQVKSFLQTTATDMGPTGFDNSFGYGRLNACGAAYKALASTQGTTLIITGDNTVCSTSNQYSINNLPPGATVQWNATPQGIVTINTPNSPQTTITRNNDGAITLTAIISNVCGGGGQITISKPNITISSAPSTTTITYYDYDPCGSYITENTTPVQGATQYIWNLSVNNIYYTNYYTTIPHLSLGQGEQPYPYFFPIYYGQYILRVQAQNTCGTSAYNSNPKVFTIQDCSYQMLLSVSPNPSNSTTEVTLSEKADKTKKKDIQEIRIVDKMGTIKQTIKFGKGKQSVLLNVASLPFDIYTILAFDGKVWTAAKFIKNQ